ncbi:MULTISPECIES: helix-turn-helix domain-containing protein [Actinosynnema]|uniref:helix-turn-helix domain-containing protein n=1 Tax=Actinosynnema TaxID=40566 RepID=UPI0020A272FA|nr:helix-turn-helix domain-containing protein [Actinosynnema pretiosum]MCP2098825.1 Helix-turn-helix domain-containing protein [Actinosynnema pretiosum]
MATADRIAFGEYLRGRRAALPAPEQSGRPRTSRRRVPGLRRQELADLAGISVEYCTRLEQGRATRPSREVLTALARALRLTAPARDHLFRLAGEPAPAPDSPRDTVRPGLLRVVRALGEAVPVTVHDGRLDLLFHNGAAAELLRPVSATGPFARNLAHRAFTAEGRAELLDGEGVELLARVAAGELRAALSRYPGDAYLEALHAELTATSADFRAHWARAEVGDWRSAVKRMRHPALGWRHFDLELLHDPERDHWVMFYAPRDDAP